MIRVLEPSSTLAVIIGAHDWSLAGLDTSKAFSNSAAAISEYLSSAQHLGLTTENICNLFDDERGASDQLKQVGRSSAHPMLDLFF